MTKRKTLVVPIHNLELTPAINNELRVGRVTFVSAEKLPRIRVRLGIKERISFYKKMMVDRGGVDILGEAPSYAALITTRTDQESLPIEFREHL